MWFFLFKRQNVFAEKLLSKYFKHNNFQSHEKETNICTILIIKEFILDFQREILEERNFETLPNIFALLQACFPAGDSFAFFLLNIRDFLKKNHQSQKQLRVPSTLWLQCAALITEQWNLSENNIFWSETSKIQVLKYFLSFKKC